MTTATAPHNYTEILDRRPKAIRLNIDGAKVWLPLKGIELDETAKTVDHKLLADKLQQAAAGERQVELPAADWESAKCVGFDVYAAPRDDRTNEVRFRIFIAKSLMDGNIAPGWVVDREIAKQGPDRYMPQTVYSGEGELIGRIG